MTHLTAIEGTGEEVSRYAQAHPAERFLLISVGEPTAKPVFDERVWSEVMERIESRRGRFPVLPDEAYSTDSLYD